MQKTTKYHIYTYISTDFWSVEVNGHQHRFTWTKSTHTGGVCKLRCKPQSYHYIIWLIHAAEKDNTPQPPQPRPDSLLPNRPKWPAAQHMSITSYAAFFYLLTLFLCLLLAATVTEQTSISPPCLFPPHLSISSRLIALHLPLHSSPLCLHFSLSHCSLPPTLTYLLYHMFV